MALQKFLAFRLQKQGGNLSKRKKEDKILELKEKDMPNLDTFPRLVC